MSFPALSPVDQKIFNKIQNTSHAEIAGNKPFIQLTKFANGTESIGYSTYKEFDLSKIQKYEERFPPIITGLECNLAGNMGTIRKAKVNIKFASSKQLANYSDFLRVGNVQMVSWGWLNKNSTFAGNTLTQATQIVLNIVNWQTAVMGYDYEVDMMAGLLVNFNIKTNDDMTVDVELELGSPSEIPGYLAFNKKGKTSAVDAVDPGEELVKIVNALDLDGNLSGTTQGEIENNSINHDWSSTMSFSWGSSSEGYIQFGFVVNTICNKFVKDSAEVNQLDARINIDYAVGMAHPNMISCSENILFPNTKTMDFDKPVTAAGRKITPTIARTQAFGPFNKIDVFPNHSEEPDNRVGIVTLDGGGAKPRWQYFAPGRAGYIRNIYIGLKFLTDSAKGCKTVNEFLEKIIAEINIAGAGLMDLVLREMPDINGKMVPSIADLNLVQDGCPTLPYLDVTANTSRVIGLQVTGDLPKEMVGEMILGEGNSNADEQFPGRNMFKPEKPDRVMKVASPEDKTTTGAELIVTPGWWDAATNIFTGKFQNFLNLPGETLIKFAGQLRIGDGVGPWFGVFKDVSVLKSIYFPKNYNKRYALLPTTVRFTVLGVSGITVGNSFMFHPSNAPVPWLTETEGFWQITNVEHKVDDSKWETSVEAKFRPGTPYSK